MPGLMVTISGNSTAFTREVARAEAVALGFSKNLNRQMQAQAAASMANLKSQLAAMESFKAKVAVLNGTAMMTDKESAAKEEAVRLVEVEEAARRNTARRLLRQRKDDAASTAKQIAEAELAASIEVATRSNLARRLVSQRQATRAAALAEDIAANALVARGFGATSHNPAGGHGRLGLTGIIRESTVIARELVMGRGMGRVAGSVTLLAQYMGLLGKVVKSTASEQLLASVAASKLAQTMAAEADAAKGTLAFSGLLKKARLQEAEAATVAKEAEIALQTAKVSVNPLGWAIIAGAAVGAVLIGWAWHLHTLAVRAKNLKDVLNPLKKSFTEMAEARDAAAKAEQTNSDWLKELTDNHKAEADQIERKIKLLHMEAEARGWSKQRTAEEEGKMLAVEKARLETELAVAIAREQSASKSSAAGAKGVDFTTGGVVDAKQAADKARRLGEIADAAAAAMEGKTITVAGDYHSLPGGGGYQGVSSRPVNDSDLLTFKADGKEFQMTMAQARENFQKASDQAAALAAAQKNLDDVLTNSKATAKEKQDALNKVNADLQTINDEKRLGAYGQHGGGAANVTERERIGLGAASSIQISILDMARQTKAIAVQQLAAQQQMVKELTEGGW